jgi:hypothetical protein
MQKVQRPRDWLIQPLLKYFQDLLELFMEESTDLSSQTIAQISLNYSNIQNVLRNVLQPEHPDLENSIYCTCHLNSFSRATNLGIIPLIDEIPNLLPFLRNHQLEVYFICELLSSSRYYPISNPEELIAQALEHLNHFVDVEAKCMLSLDLVSYVTHIYIYSR